MYLQSSVVTPHPSASEWAVSSQSWSSSSQSTAVACSSCIISNEMGIGIGIERSRSIIYDNDQSDQTRLYSHHSLAVPTSTPDSISPFGGGVVGVVFN